MGEFTDIAGSMVGISRSDLTVRFKEDEVILIGHKERFFECSAIELVEIVLKRKDELREITYSE